jgi:hypothetical protein
MLSAIKGLDLETQDLVKGCLLSKGYRVSIGAAAAAKAAPRSAAAAPKVAAPTGIATEKPTITTAAAIITATTAARSSAALAPIHSTAVAQQPDPQATLETLMQIDHPITQDDLDAISAEQITQLKDGALRDPELLIREVTNARKIGVTRISRLSEIITILASGDENRRLAARTMLCADNHRAFQCAARYGHLEIVNMFIRLAQTLDGGVTTEEMLRANGFAALRFAAQNKHTAITNLIFEEVYKIQDVRERDEIIDGMLSAIKGLDQNVQEKIKKHLLIKIGRETLPTFTAEVTPEVATSSSASASTAITFSSPVAIAPILSTAATPTSAASAAESTTTTTTSSATSSTSAILPSLADIASIPSTAASASTASTAVTAVIGGHKPPSPNQ